MLDEVLCGLDFRHFCTAFVTVVYRRIVVDKDATGDRVGTWKYLSLYSCCRGFDIYGVSGL